MSALSAALPRLRGRVRLSALAAPELLLLLGVTALLNLWHLGINGWANTYYSAAVRSMSSSWHAFLFASMDHSGLMTVDKPPLALWVQALSARLFGFHPLSILVPQALMGVVAVGLLYDLVRRRFGRLAGFLGGAVFALTPMTVAVARHNNPDELLVLCSVAAVWSALRALDSSRLRWLVVSGICVGLGFETKMAVALVVVPGIVAAWMLFAPGRRIRGLAGFGAASLVVGGAWPLLVTLTPAADRPWISGTSDNSIWSLIFGYNGLGRVAGQSGGPQAFGGGGGGGGGSFFGGSTGVFRLLHLGLGDQAGWLLGFALVAGLGLLLLTRLTRRDPRSAWLVVVGGAFAVTAVVFSFAQGIFHPYYVSLLAPFTAALVGAGAGLALAPERRGRLLLAGAIVAGAVTELVVLHGIGGRLSWATPLVVVSALVAVGLLVWLSSARHRALVVTAAVAVLLAPPAVWAADTLGHATNGTFPAGGPANADGTGPGGFAGGPNGRGAGRLGIGRVPGGLPGAQGGAAGAVPGAAAGVPGGLPGAAGGVPGGAAGGVPGAVPGAGGLPGRPPGVAGGPPGASAGTGAGPGGPGGFAGNTASLTAALRYATAHGGGTVGLSSQSTAAAAILSSGANAAGLGGFSGRESAVSPAWLAMEVRAGRLRWVIVGGEGGFGPPGDTRTGSQAAMQAVAKACRAVSLPSAGTSARSSTATGTLYDCRGRGAAIARAA